MIINIRGTHGSGKSTIVRSLLSRFDAKPESTNPKGKILNYQMMLPTGKMLYVVGNYEIACGGCDAIQPYSDIWPRVARLAELGHVVFEGALVSSSYGSIGRNSEVYGDDFVFAFLLTPLEVCYERIKARRVARGDTRPFNTKNTEGKHNSIVKSVPGIQAKGRRVVFLDYRKAVPQLLGLLYHA